MLAEPITSVSPTPVSAHQVNTAETAISIRGISKVYRIYNRPQDRLKQMLLGRFGKTYGRDFWALRNISFDVRKGEVVGIIGRNGSGKSTLLQIITGTLAPSAGEVVVNGRVAALLELGSGFKPEFTGRENVFLNGAILGIGRKEMEERFDEIAAFADIGEFIDQPVKTYSSGMMVRLAFAVQSSVEPDILIVDEALAVGDIFFRQKCYQRLETLRARGVSILLVSHSMPDIEQLCERAVLLDQGEVLFQGTASEAVKRYYLLEQRERLPAQMAPIEQASAPQDVFWQGNKDAFWPSPDAFADISQVAQVSNGWARCTRVGLCDQRGQPCHVFQQGETASFFYEFEVQQDFDVPIGGVVLQNEKGIIVHGKNSLQYGTDVPSHLQRGTRIRFQQDIALDIAPGEYTFTTGLATLRLRDYERRAMYLHPDLEAKIVRLCHTVNAGKFVVLLRHNKGKTELLHHGIANLPGRCRVMTHLAVNEVHQNSEDLRVIVTEYPKSGGSWLTSMLGDALQLPKRDIYVGENYRLFDVTKHPWYENAGTLALTGACVIKSHELPESSLIDFPARFIHMVRDGRDVVVSKYFYEKDFCVANGLYERFDEPFDDYVARVAAEWKHYVEAWTRTDVPIYKYEDFLRDPKSSLEKVIRELGIAAPVSRIHAAVDSNTKDKFKRALDKTFQHNTFVRKAVAGDWKNFFNAAQIDTFKQIAGELLIALGYEKDLAW